MKNPLVIAIAALACTLCGISTSPAQTAALSFSDGIGNPSSGTFGQGQQFNLTVTLNFAPGGNISNLEGLSYWLQQNSGGPFHFAIASRDMTGSLFTVPQTPGITYPQNMAPTNASDLGATLAGSTGVGAGTYFIANIVVTISQTAANGVYTLSSTFSGPRTSVISDDQGRTFAIAPGTYQVVIAPDTGSTVLLLGLSAIALMALARRQSVRA
jgi:hypothetical protein